MPKNLIQIWKWDKNGQPVKNSEMTATAFQIWQQLFPKEYAAWKEEEQKAYNRRLEHRQKQKITLPKRSNRTLKATK